MEKTEVLDKTSELAKEKLAGMEKAEKEKAETDQKAKEESKDASSEKSSAEKEKTEGSETKEKVEDSETTTKNDVQILESDDKDLSEDELKRKEGLVKAQEDAKTPEQKLKEWQDNTQKRIDELSGALKAEKDGRTKDADTIRVLESTITTLRGDLEQSGNLETDVEKIKSSLEAQYPKMVDEDQSKPREERREMSEAELEEFLLEDLSKATQWIVRRDRRREKELESKQQTQDTAKTISEGAKKFYVKYPDCDQAQRAKDLVASGKTAKEAFDEISGKYPDFKMYVEIMESDSKFRDPSHGPALMMAEMEKRKSSKPSEKEKTFTKAEVEKMTQEAVETEKQRIASIDEGLGNTVVGTAISSRIKADSMVAKQWVEWQKASKRPSAIGQDWSEAEFLKTLDRGKKLRKVDPGR